MRHTNRQHLCLIIAPLCHHCYLWFKDVKCHMLPVAAAAVMTVNVRDGTRLTCSLPSLFLQRMLLCALVSCCISTVCDFTTGPDRGEQPLCFNATLLRRVHMHFVSKRGRWPTSSFIWCLPEQQSNLQTLWGLSESWWWVEVMAKCQPCPKLTSWTVPHTTSAYSEWCQSNREPVVTWCDQEVMEWSFCEH